MKTRTAVAAYALLAFAGRAGAETWTLASEILKESRTIETSLPADYATSSETYPVLVVLDGESLFAPVSGLASWLRTTTRIPGLVVVGVRNVSRTRDFTTRWTSPATPGWFSWMLPAAGGSGAFLDFLEKELLPEIGRRYRVAPFRILAGHSLGGLLTLEAAASRPGLFQASIAVSPPLAWNDDEMLRRARAAGLAGSIFLAAAGNDPADTLPAYHRFVELLTNGSPAALRWKAAILPDEDHGTVAIPAIQAGILFTFDRWRLPGYVSGADLSAVRAHYASLSTHYGYPVRLQEAELARLGYQTLQAGKTGEAVALFRALTADHPESPNAFDDLGTALTKAGSLPEARAAFERAVALGEKAKHPFLPTYRRHLQGASGPP